MSFNKVILVGNLTRDIELRYSSNYSAENANQYLKRGSKILVDAHVNFGKCTDQNGQKHVKHSISVEHMKMLGK